MYPSTTNNTTSSSSSTLRSHSQPTQSHLQARIAAKRAELENLRQLRDLSAHLTTQLESLEQKLGSLRDGAQAVALVLANWDNVLRVIGMAAMKVPHPPEPAEDEVPEDGRAGREGGEDMAGSGSLKTKEKQKLEREQQLPVPLVRIPVQPRTEDAG
ncbi:uncharacterized protein Z520_06933 [Fonsecaea multimorphosa CBS 102226]|uniref:DASH complex subunit DAD2 n=1 Tax=Fonsecaea multimorphosa CBS 102226 TaxID=1442371 RepID=A0A0D2IKD6_9EURO|nr:uncharacterized protein Z520_06933 [Fonsecaea multimorphosa CBS 102226]KIX97481.1 hypothetical protein Z520_06933 [Fonsecaea multimorphosa CBS 102226]OAL23443.1 hypothetical protein AYO22_06493 [Fonsecaea multimorphosa]